MRPVGSSNNWPTGCRWLEGEKSGNQWESCWRRTAVQGRTDVIKQNGRKWMQAAVAAFWILCGGHVAVAQIATGTVAGTVKDAQGGVMPGATVALTSATRGTTINVVTNQTGDFTFPNVPGDTYTVKVTMSGFKTVERDNVRVSPGDRVVVGTITLDLGGLNEVVTVSDEAPLLQAQSGERS